MLCNNVIYSLISLYSFRFCLRNISMAVIVNYIFNPGGIDVSLVKYIKESER